MENIKNNNINTMNNNSNSSFSMTENEPATTKMQQAETSQPGLQLYISAARNLREHHGVPSMTAESLEKTLALLQLRPARLVAQGLASRKLLKGDTAVPDDSLDTSSTSNAEVEKEELKESTSDVSDSSTNSSTNSGTSSSDGDDNESRHMNDLETEDRKRPIDAALAAAGIKLRPRETRPLLLALGVRPHRLVKLGLVDREALLSSRGGGRGIGIGIGRGGIRHQRHGAPGRRTHRGGEGFGRPQHGPHPHPHHHDHGRSPTYRRHGRSSSPIHEPHGPQGPHGPPRGPFQKAGRHGHQPQDPMQPFRDVPHKPRRHGRPNHAHGPRPGARMHPHHEPARYHSGESDGEEGAVVHGGLPGRGPSRGRSGGQRGPPPHHGKPSHGRRSQGGGRHANHGLGYHLQGHPHGEDVHSCGSEGEECAGMRRGPRHHGGPLHHGEGKKCHRGRHNKRRLPSDGEDWIRMVMMATMPEGPPRWPSREAGRHHHRSAGHRHQPPPPPPPPTSPMVQAC